MTLDLIYELNARILEGSLNCLYWRATYSLRIKLKASLYNNVDWVQRANRVWLFVEPFMVQCPLAKKRYGICFKWLRDNRDPFIIIYVPK